MLELMEMEENVPVHSPNGGKAQRAVAFDALPESAFRYLDYDAIVCIDIIRATTTLVTAVAQGRRAFLAANVDQALPLAANLGDALLATESENGVPSPFEMADSPSAIESRGDVHRPLVLTGGVGTELIVNAGACDSVYVACLRNLSATVTAVEAQGARRVAVLAACSRSELRCEDLMAAARLCKMLQCLGFVCENGRTADIVSRWSSPELALLRLGNSAERLCQAGHSEDIAFILSHVDDLDQVCLFSEGELVPKVEDEVLAADPLPVARFRSRDSDQAAVPIAMQLGSAAGDVTR